MTVPHGDSMGCEGKVSFTDIGIARKAASRRTGRNAYRCRACGKYHVGTTRGKQSRNRKYKGRKH